MDHINTLERNPLIPDMEQVSAIAESTDIKLPNNEIKVSDTKVTDPTKALLHESKIEPDSSKTTTITQPIIEENKASSDKRFDKKFSWISALHKVDHLSTASAIAANVAGACIQLINIPATAKKSFARIVDVITNMSFIPYGLDGMRMNFANKNPYSFLGFFLELTTVWLSNLKSKYLVRGFATGIDQIWTATDKRIQAKFPEKLKDNKFATWKDALVEVPKVSLELLKEIALDPISTLFNSKSTGHRAILSTTGDVISTIGYALTGSEKIFGPVRDVAGALFDAEMLFSEDKKQRLSGFLFITEGVLDFIARFMDTASIRLFVNQLSHAAGRSALMLYKDSNKSAKVDESISNRLSEDASPKVEVKAEQQLKEELHNAAETTTAVAA